MKLFCTFLLKAILFILFYFFINEEPLSTFTFMHLEDVFIQSDLRYIQAIHLLSVCVFPGN